MTLEDILNKLHKLSNPQKVIFKENKFGIFSNNSLGIYHKDLKELAKEIGKNNLIALQLFDTGIYEARILCSKIYNPNDITQELMQKWVNTFENWEICDSFCMGFFAKSKYALQKTEEWSTNEKEFIKREVNDDRTYVKKAVNWSLRNIEKRNIDLHKKAILSANKILQNTNKSAQWIAKNALKELEQDNPKILDYPRELYRLN